MKAIFQYKDWSTEPPDVDYDHPPTHAFTQREQGKGICPEPTCLVENFDCVGVVGMVVFEGADGEPTGIALPCPEHRDFAYSDGWYLRFADAVTADREGRYGKTPPPTCRECGAEYDTFLWGWWGNCCCPECTYLEIQRCDALTNMIATSVSLAR